MALIEPGQMLGKYEIVQQIGVGGMSEIFEAIDTTLQRSVALKVLPPEFSADSEHVQRFRKEVLAVAALDHPGIVTIFDVGSADDLQFYAMTLLPAGNLKTRLAGDALAPTEALSITRALAGALQHAHDQAIIHRDIKPENVLFGKDGAPVLVDFGIVKVLDSASKLTQIGTSVGTPYYMSPEQAQSSSNVDARSDLYSLGVMLHEMLTGAVPFDAATSVGIALQHVNQPVPSLPPSLNALQPLLDTLMAKQQDARPASGRALQELVDAVAPEVHGLPPLSADAAPTGDEGAGEDSEESAAEESPKAEPQDSPQGAVAEDQADTQSAEQLDPSTVVGAQPRPADPATEFELMSVTPARNPAQASEEVTSSESPSETKSEAEPDQATPEAESANADPAGTGPEAELQIMVPTEKGRATEQAEETVEEPQDADSTGEPAGQDEAVAPETPPIPASEPPPAAAAAGPKEELAQTTLAKEQRPPAAAAPPVAEAKASHLRETTLIPAVKAPGNAKADPQAPPEVDSGPEAERWKVDDLYQKPPTQWHRKPVVWAGGAAGLLVIVLAVVLSGRGADEASPLELVTGEGNGAGIGLGNQAREREPEEPVPERAPQAQPESAEAPPAEAEPEENLDALLAEMLVEDAVESDPPEEAASVTPPVPEAAVAVQEHPPVEPERPVEQPQRDEPQETSAAPAAAPSSGTADDPKVAQLLLDAELLIAADQLTLPEGENAWEAYQQVLDLDPSNREALRGLARLQRTYVNRINAALDDGDRTAARQLTERLRFIDPLHPDLKQFDERLGESSGATPFQDPLATGGTGPLLIPVPAATVTLGDAADDSSGTTVTASIPAFALAAYEVTVGEYRQFAEATGLAAPSSADEGCNYWLFNWRQRADKSWDSPGFTQSESHPAVCVSYNDALAYTRWLSEQTGFSYSLPTEYQWEYAAALDATTGVYWTSSRDACDLANVSDLDRAERHNLEVSTENIFGCRDRRVNTGPVGSYTPTAAGLYDLLGNAGEWTLDCWRQDYSAASTTGGCEASAVRGGSWFERPREVSVRHRLRLERSARFSHVGFRVVRDLE
ncbi:MAG: SUMF1/EgtB/PvdO family nonheme iron enzyme [Pseudomonadota bacterium]